MKRQGITLAIIVSFLLLSQDIYSQASNAGIPEDFCITQEEYQLFRLISDYRKEAGLSAIPLSTSLSYVARLHVRDLNDNGPDTSYCNLNSWSDKGPWTPCCHSKYTPHPECILNKPGELTGYPGEGHELVYWDSEAALPDTVYQFWLTIDQAKNMFLNQDKWALHTWRAMGVGVYLGYASVWLGDEADPEKEPVICKTVEAAQIRIPGKPSEMAIIDHPTGRFYLIYGSYEVEEVARAERNRFVEEGFLNARVLIKDGHYRVSISDHANREDADKFRSQLPQKYQEAWILKF